MSKGWNYISNHDEDEDGRVILIWKAHAIVKVFHKSIQILTCEVAIGSITSFMCTVVYAPNQREEITYIWVKLLNLFQSHSLHSYPWLLGVISTRSYIVLNIPHPLLIP